MAQRWRCDVCGYIHDGDAPPDICPLCGVGPELFSAVPSAPPAAPATPPQTTVPSASTWRCDVCGHVHRGEAPPRSCPQCGQPADMFSAADDLVEVARWRCSVCGNEHTGESPPETCPLCGAGASRYRQARSTHVRPPSPAVRHECLACGYLHQGAEPPEVCPLCGVGSDQFRPHTAANESAPASPAKPEPTSASRWECRVCGYLHEGPQPPEECPLCGVDRTLFERRHDAPAPPPVADEVLQLVVAGGGIAGLTAAEEARIAAPNARITLISGEGLPYNRMDLTRLLAGEVGEAELALREPAQLTARRIDLLQGRVTHLDPAERELTLTDGRIVRYDRLVLATGAHALLPSLPGITREGVHPLRRLSDARSIQRLARPGVDAVVIGGGLLGLEVGAALARLGLHVSVVERSPQLLPHQLPPAGAELLEAHLQGRGVTVHTGVEVAELSGDEAVSGVVLTDGRTLAAGLVVVGIGVRPNADVAARAGLEVARGVVVDGAMATSDPFIWAAGDVAEHQGVLYGLWGPSWQQGRVAGRSAVGQPARFNPPPPSTRLKVVEVDVFSAGRIHGEGLEQDSRVELGRLVHLSWRDSVLAGVALLGDTSLATSLLQALGSPRDEVEPLL